MGLRGRLPTPEHLRAIHDGRRRRRAIPKIHSDVERQLLALANEYQRTAEALLAHLRKRPTVSSKANGIVANPVADKAAKFGEAAVQILLRLGRIDPSAAMTGDQTNHNPDPLEAFQRTKH